MSRELDAEIAEKVMGLTPVKNEGGMVFTRWREWVDEGDYYYESEDEEWHHFVDEVPHYSTDIAAAWQVVEHLYHTGMWDITIRVSPVSKRWICSLDAPNRTVSIGSSDNTAPLAICHAALKAVAR